MESKSKFYTTDSGFYSSSIDKYHGLIKQSVVKQISQNLYSFFSYIYTIGRDFDWLNVFVRYWRVWCALVPAFCANFPIYEKGSFAFNLVNVLSIPAHWIPINDRKDSAAIFLLVYSLVILFFILALIIAAVYLAKKSLIGNNVPNVFIFLCSSIILVINYPAANIIGETIGRMITKEEEFSVLLLLDLLLALVSYNAFLLMLTNYITICASFRPFSLMTVTYLTQICAVSIPAAITLFLGIASVLPKLPRVIISLVTVLFYGFLSYTPFLQGGYVYPRDSLAVQSTSITGMVSLIMFTVQDILDSKVISVQFFAIIAIFCICLFVVKYINNAVLSKYIVTLDVLLDDIDALDEIKSVNKYINILVYGFSIGHPVCINWSLCQAGCQRWADNKDVWYVFLKFVAIYPDQNYHLNTIFRYFNEESNTKITKQILTEIGALVKVRESNLSAPLKDKLNLITREVNSAKHKLRNICDIVIQGNIKEMEKAVANTYDAVIETQRQYNHLIRQYPNNRFVTRSYSRYLLEICSNIKESIKYDNATKLIQRGLQANPDKAHVLGIKAFPALPDSYSKLNNPMSMMITASEDGTTELGTDVSLMDDKMINLEEEINNIKFPKINAVNIVRFTFLVLLWIIPLIAICIYGVTTSTTVSEPLSFIEYIGKLSIYAYMIPSLSMQLVLEKSNVLLPLNVTGPNNLNTTNDLLLYYIKDATDFLKKMSYFQSYRIGNKLFDEARKCIYTDLNDKIVYDDNLNVEIRKSTTISQITDLVVSGTSIIKEIDSINSLQNKLLLGMINNADTIIKSFDESIDKIILFTSQYQKSLQNTLMIITFSVFGVSTIIWIIGVVFSIKNASKEKEVIYKSLTILPKNVISGIIDKLKFINKGGLSSQNNSESDINKQEDNIIKILATAGDSDSNNSTFSTLNAWITAAGIIEVLVIIVLFNYVIIRKTINLNNSGPQIKSTIFTYVYHIGSTIPLLNVFANEGSSSFNFTEAALKIKALNHKGYETFSDVRYGNNETKDKPFGLVVNKFDDTNLKGGSPEIIYMLKSVVVNKLYSSLINSKEIELDKNVIFKTVENDLMLYNKFFNPIEENAVYNVLDTASMYTLPTILIISIITIFIISQEIYVYSKNLLVQRRLRFTLKLLMHCPANVIQQSTRIMNILAGNFDTHRVETATRGSDYFLEIINNLPDGFIVSSKKEGIILMNNSAKRLFGDVKNPSTQVSDLLQDIDEETFNQLGDGTSIKTIYKTENGDSLNLEVHISTQEEESIYSIRDNTQNIRYNQLIAEERQRSDMLLASILPPKLVPRVQSGEKDISFEVQTASVIFMDIVEFTPWCASHEADFIMRTLNRLFTEFDDLVARSSTLTRIKCIGDCYMAAGGIFSELNQPDVHARESVIFGIDAISVVQNVGKEINENLRIRVGINTGGPLVAGVIGIGKPTFEIIGPVINMAQQMEHHGVPMHVHISRSVYELIYGSAKFDIKERGQIEIKNGTAVTYLVTGTSI